MKKVMTNILIISILIILFLVDQYISLLNLKIMPNLILIYFSIIALNSNYKVTLTLAFLIGIIQDYLFYPFIGVNVIAYIIIGIFFNYSKNILKNDSKLSSILHISIATLLFEIIKYYILIRFNNANFEFFEFFKILILEILMNILIVLIIYFPISKFKNLLKNNFAKSNILTRYF